MSKPLFKYPNAYNPNRFNALDGGLSFAIVLLAFEIIPIIVVFLFKSLLRELLKTDFYAYMIVNLVLSQSIIFAVAFIWCRARKANPFSGGGYVAKFDFVHILMGIVLMMGIMMTFYSAHMQLADSSETLLGEFGYSDIKVSPFSGFFVLTYLGLVIVLPAIVEEMLFRGIIMRGLEEYGSVFAVIVSSAMFSLMHGSFSQMLLQFLGGLAIGSVVMITKNWLIGSLMHAFNNFFSTVFQLITTYETVTTDLGFKIVTVANMACIIIGVACLIVGALFFIKLAFKKKLAKEKGEERIVYAYEKRERYAVTDGFEVTFKQDEETAELKRKNEEDNRRFYINGEFRKLNAKSPKAAAIIFMAVSFSLAIIFIFI